MIDATRRTLLLLLVLAACAAQAHLTARGGSALQPVAARRPRGARCAAVLESAAERAAVAEEVDPGEVAGLRVLKYPHPLLRAPNEEIAAFDNELRDLSRRMFKMMYASKGVGLAAPQVGVNKRLLVFNAEGDERNFGAEVVMVNPKIVARSDGTELGDEGCLSFPGFGAQVDRAKWVKVKAFNLKGNPFTKKYEGWDARIFLHEYDHLEGTLYVDRLSDEERQIVQTDLDRLVGLHGPDGAL
jgi:peptide deformylase